MDLRVWQWSNPWEKRTYLLYSLFYLCLLLREQTTAAEAGYRQESQNEVEDSNKLDSLSNYLPYYSKEDSDYKRGSAFFPLRGKKYSSDDSPFTPHRLLISDEMEDKRSQFYPLRGKKVPDDLKRASYFMPMRGRKGDGWMDEDYDITDESPNKRASSFMPMRGKKKYADISDYLTKAGTYRNDVSEVVNPSNSHSNQSNEKSIHFFVPVRGKRSYKESESPNMQVSLTNNSLDDTFSEHSAKKRSVAFMPMRGRRETEKYHEDVPGGIVTSLLEKKKHLNVEPRENVYSDDIRSFDKKAVFMPMRGRRFSDDEDHEEFDTEKRAQSFMPMRGRRTQLRDVVFEGSNAPDIKSRLIEDKRASSFMPMRGRKSDSEETKEFEIDKKASAFTLMRGRRSTSHLEDDDLANDSLDLQKRVSFMPMRGRRLVDEDFEVEPWPADQLMSLLDKKSSAFMPMRGRRMRENFTVDPWPAEELMSLFNKRATFLPMRGRRDNLDYSSEIDSSENSEKRSSAFMPMRGRRFETRGMNFYNPYPYLMAGMGSSLMSKPYSAQGVSYSSPSSAEERRKKLLINWDAVKRAFHATRGKRVHEDDDFVQSLKNSYTSGDYPPTEDARRDSTDDEDVSRQTRTKRSIVRPRVAMQPNRQYIALKRPMSFFATRGKRLDDSAIDKLSKLR